MKYREDFIKRDFLWWLRIQKEGISFVLVWRIMLSRKRIIKKKSDHMNFIIVYLKNRRVGV